MSGWSRVLPVSLIAPAGAPTGHGLLADALLADPLVAALVAVPELVPQAAVSPTEIRPMSNAAALRSRFLRLVPTLSVNG
jgi:hypothetical protein